MIHKVLYAGKYLRYTPPVQPTPHDQLEVIYRQLGRSTGFRGFTPGFVAAVAVSAVVSTLLATVLGPGRPLRFTALVWCVAGAVIALAVVIVVLAPAMRSASGIRREAAQATAIQMTFPLAVGLAATTAILVRHQDAVPYLPALWLALFGLGVAALSGLIRERVEYAAGIYLLAAGVAYLVRPETSVGFSLAVGAPFTVGHLLTAWILKRGADVDAPDDAERTR